MRGAPFSLTAPLAPTMASIFPVRIVLIPLMACLMAGCGRLVNLHGLRGVDDHIEVGNRVERELFETGPHYIRHVVVSKPLGEGWKTAIARDETNVRYWKDVSGDH